MKTKNQILKDINGHIKLAFDHIKNKTYGEPDLKFALRELGVADGLALYCKEQDLIGEKEFKKINNRTEFLYDTVRIKEEK